MNLPAGGGAAARRWPRWGSRTGELPLEVARRLVAEKYADPAWVRRR